MKMRWKAAKWIILCSALIFTACYQDGANDFIPKLTTVDATRITSAKATSGGVITSAGTDVIISSGVCWSATSSSPTINDNTAEAGATAIHFSATIRGLSESTTYYARAYATNIYGTGYGNTITFTTLVPQNALVYIDYAMQADNVADALTAEGYAPTIAANASEFKTGLASGAYPLAVLFAQSLSAVYNGITASNIQNYIDGGGMMIFATWTDSDAAIAAVFEASLTVSYNLSSVTVSDAYIQSVAGLSTFTLSSPGWGVYSTGLSAINGGTVLATFENGDAAMVLGNNGKTMMLGYLSDTTPTDSRQVIFESVIAKVSASSH